MSPKVIQPQEGRWLNIMNNKVCLKLTGEDTDGRYVLIEERDVAGRGIPLHVHEREDEVFQVVQGQVRFQIGEDVLVGDAGTIIYAPRGVPHSYELAGDGESCLQVAIFPSGLERMFEELAEIPADAPPDMTRVTAICERYGVKFLPRADGG